MQTAVLIVLIVLVIGYMAWNEWVRGTTDEDLLKLKRDDNQLLREVHILHKQQYEARELIHELRSVVEQLEDYEITHPRPTL